MFAKACSATCSAACSRSPETSSRTWSGTCSGPFLPPPDFAPLLRNLLRNLLREPAPKHCLSFAVEKLLKPLFFAQADRCHEIRCRVRGSGRPNTAIPGSLPLLLCVLTSLCSTRRLSAAKIQRKVRLVVARCLDCLDLIAVSNFAVPCLFDVLFVFHCLFIVPMQACVFCFQAADGNGCPAHVKHNDISVGIGLSQNFCGGGNKNFG